MEPRALSNVNGSVKVESSSASSARRSGADWDTMQEFIRLTPTTPKPSRGPEGRSGPEEQDPFRAPSTPAQDGYDFNFNFDTVGMSPATPYYLTQGAKLVQQTCPPKQTRQGLFPVSGRIEEQPNEKLRARLEAARRKSLAFKPAVASPLSRLS